MAEIDDAFEAASKALRYLSKKGIVVFNREVKAIFRDYISWSVIIDSDKFTGTIILKARTGEVAKEIPL